MTTTATYRRYVDDPTTGEKELRARSGQRVELIGEPYAPDADEPSLILQRVRFADGYEDEAFPDELHDPGEVEGES